MTDRFLIALQSARPAPAVAPAARGRVDRSGDLEEAGYRHWAPFVRTPIAYDYVAGLYRGGKKYCYLACVKQAGKEVLFMVDGNVDAFVDDVMACGARGIISEPYADYKAIARRHRDCFLAGEGDNRILTRNDPDEIEAMVRSMVETARLTGGYMMCIGNHIPWNVPPPAIKLYLDLSAELAVR